jgi:type IV secretion system protein VirD4
MLDKEDKDFSGVHSTAKTCLSLYADPVVALNTSESDFEIKDLVRFDIPISLYLVVPSERRDPLATTDPAHFHHDRQPAHGEDVMSTGQR